MKIISKFKDFYDYNSIYDTDESIVYSRERIEFQIRDIEDVISNRLGIRLSEKDFVDTLKECEEISKNVARILKDRRNDSTYIGFLYDIVGIYPNIYILPMLCKFSTSFYGRVDKIFEVYEYSDSSKYFSLDTFERLKKNNEGMDFISFTGRKKNKKPITSMRIKEGFLLGRENKNSIIESPEGLVKENRDFFRKLGAPVFCITCSGKYYPDFIINPCLIKDVISPIQELTKDSSIYNRIEEFIIESGIKDIPEPDNNVKIKNAGFDTKTSFRNM